MKQLKESTINRYSADQLAKHADRFQDYHNVSMYRFDFAYGKVYKFNGESFVFFTTIHPYNRSMLLNAIESIYGAIK